MYKFFNKNNSKYNNRKIKIDNHVFDSLGEANRYRELKMLLRGGMIRNLQIQPIFTLQEKFTHENKCIRAIQYVADFQYETLNDQKWVKVVEDYKGYKTDIYLLKKKMFLKLYGKKYEFIESNH